MLQNYRNHVLEIKHVFAGHIQHELWFTLGCLTANYGSSEEAQ